jgi:hypothetical protein
MANTINITSDTVVKLIIRRGTNTDRQGIVLANGELGYAYDIKRVFVGDGVNQGGNLVGNINFGTGYLQTYSSVAQSGDILFQSQTNTGAPDNTLYAFQNGNWQSIHPQYSLPSINGSPVIPGPFSYTKGYLDFNPSYLNFDINNSVLSVLGSLSASNSLNANTVTIYSQPVVGTDGANKIYVDGQIAAAEGIDQAYTRTYVGNNYVPLSGQATVFGTLYSTTNVSVSTAPANGNDVTNKTYVDTSVANVLNAAKAYSNNFLPLAGGTLTGPLITTFGSASPAITINQGGGGDALFINANQPLHVNSYGNVGIGVIPPLGGTTLLSVSGTANIATSLTTPTIISTTTNSTTVNATTVNGTTVIGTSVVGSGSITSPAITGTNVYATLLGVNTSVNGLYPLNVGGAALINGTITTTGTISAGGDVLAYYTSDQRLKNNVVPITSALDKIDKINGVEYDWNTDLQSIHSGHDIGVLAQEIEEIIPEAVTTRPDGYKAVRYDKIIPLLIQAIKELKANQSK